MIVTGGTVVEAIFDDTPVLYNLLLFWFSETTPSQSTTSNLSASNVSNASQQVIPDQASRICGPFQNSISLMTLVRDTISSMPNSSGVTITSDFISKAIENSSRNFNKPAVLANLQAILSQELESGHFVRVGPDTYTVPPNPPPTRPFLIQQNTPPSPASNAGQPSQVNFQQQSSIVDMQAHQDIQQQKNATSNCPDSLLKRAISIKSEEERKNDLIQERISKMTAGSSKDKDPKGKSPFKKVTTGGSNSIKEPFYVTLREKRLAGLSKKKAAAELAKKTSKSVNSNSTDISFHSQMERVAQTEEEAKKDALAIPLIEEALAKNGTKLKGRAKRLKVEALKRMQSQGLLTPEQLQVATVANVCKVRGGSGYVTKKRKQKEEWQMGRGGGSGGESAGRPGSKREKVCLPKVLCIVDRIDVNRGTFTTRYGEEIWTHFSLFFH